MNQQRWRIIVSAVAGLTVCIFALVTASRNGGRLLQIPYDYALSSDSQTLQGAISTFRQQHGDLPADLAQLGLREGELTARRMKTDDAGRPLDPWGVPYVYRTDGQTYEIVTWAADQKPGGIGGDADVRVAPMGEDEMPTLEPPTFFQYLFEYAMASAIATCVAAGVCTFLVGAIPRRNAPVPPIPPGSVYIRIPDSIWIRLIFVGALSAYMAGALAVWHLPFDHH